MNHPILPTSADFSFYVEHAKWRLTYVKSYLHKRRQLRDLGWFPDPYEVQLRRLELVKLRAIILKLARVRGYFRATLREHGTDCPPPLFDARG